MSLSKTIRVLPFIVAVLFACMGCPYKSEYPLSGEVTRYQSDLIGSWHSDTVELVITKVDDYTVKVHYNDHDAAEAHTADGLAKVVKNAPGQYLVLKMDEDGKYCIAKILKNSSKELLLNILDDAFLDKEKIFGSQQEFSDYIYANAKEVFPALNKTVFKRDAD